jgi:hypothetical protein
VKGVDLDKEMLSRKREQGNLKHQPVKQARRG